MMRIPIVALLLTSAGFAQYHPGSAPRTYGYSASGFGSVMFPGGAPGHPAVPGNITNPGFAGALGATVRGVPPYGAAMGGRPLGSTGGRPGGGRSIIIPYPIYAGPAYYPYGYSEEQMMMQQAPPQQQQPPVVIINQNYRPDTVNPQVRDYSSADLPKPSAPQQETLKVYENRPRRVVEDEKPTIYLIAMRDGSVMQALAFWTEGDTLNYITRESSHNRISLDRVDRDFSIKLNQERGLEVRIP